ncbi:MAG: DNA replication/repair protein RecF [Clostridium sp.]|nr:DNA replication/repair protein RecF [Clostridium sp.]
MFIKSVNLKNYRNYDDLNLEFSSDKILLIGKNAQGKTNLLEAVYYLSCLNSARTKTDSELILWQKDFARLGAVVQKGDLEKELQVLINPPRRKELKVNGVKKNKSSEFCSNLSVVSFSVNDLLLLRGVPDDRRGWLDMAISQIYPAYPDRVSKYNKIRIQKNNYLKEIKGNINADKSMLEIWNSQLAVAGSNIIFLRLKFLKELQKIAMEKHLQIAQQELLTTFYNSTVAGDVDFGVGVDLSIEKIAELFEKKLQERQLEEIIRAQSLVGPHRDDVSFFINGIEAKKFASQGQQRTIVLSLKLAELELVKGKIDDTPVLLLDDVLAELDNIRQNFLLNAIGHNIQTIITSVDTLHFDAEYLKDVEIFKISNGAII